ncbi:uncharacterized protein znf469.L [Xenopus laevis]|uniref:Uncharacterized protein znf469.L n=2 Tax=Xenopus laevis TaxID=8355 RepID=A0A1L8GL46_XENLA|nr:uncharacterized protein znf469.L [Xenopus laevis]XP_018113480.1 uncharacterized protein znf469.L [Xenopus laevis]XP_041446141.1 uncharacterized protein znf469.L [Xenopus laevis]OCT84549.1 hypothetical protein XELAEV_18022702mg [Xenopus laevis]
MTGETKHVYAISTKESNCKDSQSGSAFEQFNNNERVISSTSSASDTCGNTLSGSGNKASQLNGRDKETHNQREAIIRPQKAGKIDFKLLHNRPKFSTDTSWTNSRSNALSPTGKSRGKDKTRRSGKGDRTQYQLCRLNITNSRPNPTIGIAYPQQQVTPPKKLEVNQGPIAGSYRFHVPNVPERETELQQKDLSFNRCFQESSPSLTSTSYTSASVSRGHPGLKLQPPLGNLHETSGSNVQLHFLEFQQNGNSWHPSEKNFSGANSYGVSNQKRCTFSEGKKSDPHCFGSMQYQYPFQPLQEATGNTFCNNAGGQEFVDVSLSVNQLAHNAFSFQSSSREGPDDPQSNGPYNGVDRRTYVLPSPQAPFLHVQQDAQHSPTLPCYTGRNEHNSDHNGAIISSGAITSSGAIDQTQSTFQESQSVFNNDELSLHSNGMPTLGSKRQPPTKDFAPSQKLLTSGNALRRNMPQDSLNQVHFPSKGYSNGNTGSAPFDKSISRLPQTWDAGSKTFPPMDQNSASFANSSGKLVPYQCQSNPDQRQQLKHDKIPWQQVHLMPPVTSQNRLELQRQTGNQKRIYPSSTTEWDNNNIKQNSSAEYHTKKNLTVEGFSTQRTDGIRQSYSFGNAVMYDSVKDASPQICESRNKGVLFGINQQVQHAPSARKNNNQSGNLAAVSPCESPLPSPVTNAVSGSTCSSLSPMSSSPLNPSSDESQKSTLNFSPYFHQPCPPVEGKPFHLTDTLNSNSLMYHPPEAMKQFSYLTEISKDEHLFKNTHESQYTKQSNGSSNDCMENFETEPPPPPPYSAQHLLANSLSSTNLDQLNVLLTCKQCDQNYSNLSSFLEHRQYCSMNFNPQNDLKDPLRASEVRKQVVDPLKATQTTSGLSKGPLEIQQQLIGFNKAVDYFLESDAKGDFKDESMKVNTFHSLTSNMSLTSCDTLEMDDAKLDSLITEALNGLEFQVENAEIDSSFIDVFVDDDPSTPKAVACGQAYKLKEPIEHKRKQTNVKEKQGQSKQTQYIYEENSDIEHSCNHRNKIKRQSEQKNAEFEPIHPYYFEKDKPDIVKKNPEVLEDHELVKQGKDEEDFNSELKGKISIIKNDPEILYDNKKHHDSQRGRNKKTSLPDFSMIENQKPHMPSTKEVKKKKSYNGTWSKELIHKIVQQKNKLHKLHVKNNKNGQFSLVTERHFPANKSHPFAEYDYISDSEDDSFISSSPEKRTPNGKLKYAFNRDHHGRELRIKAKDPVWRVGEATRFQLKNKDLRNMKKDMNRIRRRSSQSSTSSDQSTSNSSETGSSPKSTERTDSEFEQDALISHHGLDVSTRNIAIKPLCKESLPKTMKSQMDYSKGTKKFGSARFLLAGSKTYQAKLSNSTNFEDKSKLQKNDENECSNKNNCVKSTDSHYIKKAADEEQRVSSFHKAVVASTLSQGIHPPDLIQNAKILSQQCSSFQKDSINFQETELKDSTCLPAEFKPALSMGFSDANDKYIKEGLHSDLKDFAIAGGCYSADPVELISTTKNQETYTHHNQAFPEHTDLPSFYDNNIFCKTQNLASQMGQEYLNQSSLKSNNETFEHKSSNSPPFPSKNNDENKLSSTLSFDSPSLFAELPMSEFGSPLYTNAQPAKDSYVDYICTDDQLSKSTGFEQQYPQFLQEKSWDITEEASTIICNDMAHFQVLDSQDTEKYHEVPGSSRPVSLALSETITDFNTAFINTISEDELEIKRLVTELESQLQTNKLHNEAASQMCLKNPIRFELPDSSAQFQNMVVSSAEIQRKNMFFKETRANKNEINCSGTTVSMKTNLQDCQPLEKVEESRGNVKSPWTCSVQFDTFNSKNQCHEPRPHGSFSSTDNCSQYQLPLNVGLQEELNSLPNIIISPTAMPDVSKDQSFSENDVVLKTVTTTDCKIPENYDNKTTKIDSVQNNSSQDFPNKQQLDDNFDDPPELEPFHSGPESFHLQGSNAPLLNITNTPENKPILSNERLPSSLFGSDSPVSTVQLRCNENSSCRKEQSPESVSCRKQLSIEKTNQSNLLLLDMPVLVKEESAVSEKLPVVQESTDNPLQQLQLFVARTAKTNEEEMLIPCFPLLLPTTSHAGSQSEMESDSFYVAENALSTSTEASETCITTAELKETHDLSEAKKHSTVEQLHALESEEPCSEILHQSLSSTTPKEGDSCHNLENKCQDVVDVVMECGSQGHEDKGLSNGSEKQIRKTQKVDNQKPSDINENNIALKQNEQIDSTSFKFIAETDAFTVSSKNTSTATSNTDIHSHSDLQHEDYVLPYTINTDIQKICKDTNNHEAFKASKDTPVFLSPESHLKDMNMVKEKDIFMGNDEVSKCTTTEFNIKSDTSLYVEEPSAHFPLHHGHLKALQEGSLEYHIQLQDINEHSVNSQFGFDAFAHIPADASEQMVFSATDNVSCSRDNKVLESITKCQVKGETSHSEDAKAHTIDGTDALIYTNENRYADSSLVICPTQPTKLKDLISPISKENIPSCFCPDLLCSSYKEHLTNPVADILLRCHSMPASDGYPMYTETDNNKQYSAHQTQLFTEDLEIIRESSMCGQKDENITCNWSNTAENSHINCELHSEDREAPLTCDLMDIAESEFAGLRNQEALGTTDARLIQSAKDPAIIENVNTSVESEIKCTSDMDSVILRILDCDKSKEILESIGIPSRNCHIKDKKPTAMSLTCNICSISFKSKTGLTRHKAVKHNTKNDGSVILQKEIPASETSSAIHNWGHEDQIGQKTSKTLIHQTCNTDSIAHNPFTETQNQECGLPHPYVISNDSALSSKSKGGKKDKSQSDTLDSLEDACKKKLNGKVKKRKAKLPVNKCTDSQVPSDDILNMLKTNLLKAIGQTSSFSSNEDKNAWNQPSKNDNQQVENGIENSLAEPFTTKTFSVEADEVMRIAIDLQKNGSVILGEQIWEKDANEQPEQVGNDVRDTEIPLNEETQFNQESSINDLDMCLEKNLDVKDIDYSKKDLLESDASKEADQDLHSLFDDDNTFSQLFPRDDHFIRRKCTRVYGKKAKRQTPPFEPDIKSMPESTHTSHATNYTCNYRNISIDSTLICDNNSSITAEPHTDHTSLVKTGTDIDEIRIMPISPVHLMENNHMPLLPGESQNITEGNVCFEDSLYNSVGGSKDSFAPIRDSELEGKYNSKMSDNTSLPEFPTIDMKMLSAKFDMSELSFFSACGDDSDQSDVETQDVTTNGGQQKRNSKNRTGDKRQARHHGNINIKTKDKQYKCKVCFQWFLTLGELDFHKLTHNPSPPPTCYMCVQRKFSSREQLRDHLKEKHSKNKAGLWICGMCLKEISDVWMYNEHLREHATQFARKGQAQKSVIGIPGCFSEDSMVRTFLSTFIYRTPSKSSKTTDGEDKSPSVKKQNQAEQKDDDDLVVEKEQVRSIQNITPAPVHVKLSVSAPLETTQKSDTVQKNVSVHPHCKDPSRDCHHCGKQFPKPFKLQRHLVVHSLQKIYLCHRCPNSYQEVQELRSHLNSKHQLAEEEIEIKHTTLYACELCADVMHVIKKSFICSTCNYTFSKKEQYDRHMEKHLIGGSMIFKFRGVMRPGTSGKEVREKRKEAITNENIPPPKKTKNISESEPDSPPALTCFDVKTSGGQSPYSEFAFSSQLTLNTDLSNKSENEQDIAVKIEYMQVDMPTIHEERIMDDSLLAMGALCMSPVVDNLMKTSEDKEDKEEDIATEMMKSLSAEIVSSTAKCNKPIMKGEEDGNKEPPILNIECPKIKKKLISSIQVEETANVPELECQQTGTDDGFCQFLSNEAAELSTSNKDMSVEDNSHSDVIKTDKEDTIKSVPVEADISGLIPKEKAMIPEVHVSLKDSKSLKKSRSASHITSKTVSQMGVTAVCDEDAIKNSLKPCTPKAKNLLETSSFAKKEMNLSKHASVDTIKPSDKVTATELSKMHPKSRKEHKISGTKACSGSQENLSGDGKTKKLKLLGTGKTETIGNLKKPEWAYGLSAFSELKDEALLSRHHSKPNSGGTNSQFKKNMIDAHNQKKQNCKLSNGEYKSKNSHITKTLHPFAPKCSTSSPNSVSNRRRLGPNTKPTEPLNYRTAESQNNLLSQLFGQKLTSFKIPLRRDVTD